jgi:stage II sporulation protein P
MNMMASENHHFWKNLDRKEESLLKLALEGATNINFKDVRSLIYDEIPGLFTMTSEIIVAGQGSDFTNMPFESSPPLEELLKDREVREDSLEHLQDDPGDESMVRPEVNTVFIYHTHNRESFLPHLKDSGQSSAVQHKDINITLVGKRFGDQLAKYGIGAAVDDTDIAAILAERNWEYWQSYQVSRERIQEAMAGNQNLVYFFDIHRDSARRRTTTTTINGKSYAKIYFVVGESHPNYKENESFAIQLEQRLREKYPSLSRGIVRKNQTSGNGIYNQDLSSRSLIIEIGGVENTLEEMYNTVEVLAEVFADYYYSDGGKQEA